LGKLNQTLPDGELENGSKGRSIDRGVLCLIEHWKKHRPANSPTWTSTAHPNRRYQTARWSL